MTSHEVGRHRAISSALILIALAGSVRAQGVIAAPPSGEMIDVMRETFDATDEQTRFESISWIRSRTTPAAFQVLRRASRDPVPAIAFEGLLGLAEIAPEYELDGYQMRHLPGQARAELVRRAAEQGLIGLPSLRAIAMDSSAEHAERTEALLAMQLLGEPPRPALWLPMLGSTDDRVRLLAALSIVTDSPRIRSVAIAQDHATSIVRQSVRDASSARISTVIRALADARRAPSPATADWCLALLGACSQESDEHRLVYEEALRTALTVSPQRVRKHWEKWCQASTPDDVTKLAGWALEVAVQRDARNASVPGWLADLPHRDATDASAFVRASGLAIEAMSEGRSPGSALVEILVTGGPTPRRLAAQAILDLPEHDRAEVITSFLERAQDATRIESSHIMALARDLASIDPISAQVALEQAEPGSLVARCLVLSGVWSPTLREGSTLGLLRALWLAEREIEGARTEQRSSLAGRLELITNSPDAFSDEIRAEAAWLALVLRDQTSEAMANLPVLSPVYDDDLSLELEQADSLLQWAQMPYP